MARIRSVHPDNWKEAATVAADGKHLYVLQEEDDGPAKIGVARNAFWRRFDLQVGNHRRLYLRAVYLCADKTTACSVESAVLREFAEHRITGEWMAVNPAEIINYINEGL